MRTAEQIHADYVQFRGQCKALAEAAAQADASLTVVRGWYHCPMWGEQPHWWCVAPDGTIVDPSVRQFPTAGVAAEYEPYVGVIECAQCGKEGVAEADATINGNYGFCSSECACRFVGL